MVDTNAWIQHLRVRDPTLVKYLSEQRVHTTEVVIGELLLGTGLPSSFARELKALPRLSSPSSEETRVLIERHRRAFSGSGVGWADAQIVLAAAKTHARLYTRDRGVRRVSKSLGVLLA